MTLTAKWDEGISICYNDDFVFFDLQSSRNTKSKVFISHAHSDHSKAFSFAAIQKYSTRETYEIIKALGKKPENWLPVDLNRRLRVGDLEVVPHVSGHVLGSALFEVISPEATVVYTGDLNFEDTYTMKMAEIVRCDILIIEATFGSPSFIFPSKDELAYEMSKWAVDSVLDRKVPIFKTDALGNAQEIICILNKFTSLPVVTHWKVSRINRIYEAHGYKLDYVDYKSEEAEEIISSGEYAYIAPKGMGTPHDPGFSIALASGWAIWNRGEQRSFAYSDHADYVHLLDFVKECRPDIVLTCFGKRFDYILAREIWKKLGIEAYPLSLISTRYSRRK